LPDKKPVVSLRTVAERVGLAPCSVSAILNNTPASWAIPQRTKDRVLRAAAELNYRPNYSARSLRTKRTHMVAVVSADFARAPVARLVAGMERVLRRRGYLLVLGAFNSASEWNSISAELQQRGIEGVISVGTNLPRERELPVVSVDFAYVDLREPLGESACAWLANLGESAVEAVLSRVEKKDVSGKTKTQPKMKLVPKIADDYFNLPTSDLGTRDEITAVSE